MNNKFILYYETKGMDYWWTLILDIGLYEMEIGRGIVRDSIWNDFINLFAHNNILSVQVVERKL